MAERVEVVVFKVQRQSDGSTSTPEQYGTYYGTPGEVFGPEKIIIAPGYHLTINHYKGPDSIIAYKYQLNDSQWSVVLAGAFPSSNQKISIYYAKNSPGLEEEPSGGKDPSPKSTGTYIRGRITPYLNDLRAAVGEGEEEPSAVKYPTAPVPTPTVMDKYGTGCYFLRYSAGVLVDAKSLPVYPTEFTDDNKGDFNDTPIPGRSVAYQTYTGSSRSVNFALTLHEEIVDRFATSETNSAGLVDDSDGRNYDYIHELVASIQSACYPEYSEGVVNAPEVEFIIGNQFSIRGILTNCGALWKQPIVNGKYVCCDLSISVTETTGPYSASDINRVRGKRGSYNVT